MLFISFFLSVACLRWDQLLGGFLLWTQATNKRQLLLSLGVLGC